MLACAAALALACAGSSHEPTPATGGATVAADDADVQATLTRACYGCHAEAGALPWQAKLTPSAWFAGAARGKLDFSTWEHLTPERRGEATRAIDRVVQSGEMPPWDSALFDAGEKLSAAEKERIARWASQTAAQ